MSQPVKVADALVLDARLMGEATQRSVAGQNEFWARLGRAVETVLRGDQLLALAKSAMVKPLSASLQSVDLPEGRQRLAEHLNSWPYPHCESAPGGLLLRIEANGKRTTGRFVNRRFQRIRAAKK